MLRAITGISASKKKLAASEKALKHMAPLQKIVRE